MEKNSTDPSFTPLPVIAAVSRIVTQVVDRVTGDRVDFPLLVAAACVEGLKCFGIESRMMFGQVAWVEVMEDHSVIWAGCWGENFHFWVATQWGEIVDLNTSIAYRKRSHSSPQLKALYSPPIIWSTELPAFYRCIPEGVAEIELLEESDKKKLDRVISEVQEKCKQSLLDHSNENRLDFPNEAILCPQRKLLDDQKGTFQYFDRAIAVGGIPKSPI